MLHLFEVGALAAHVGAGDDGEVALGRGRDIVGHDDGAHVVQDRVTALTDDQGFTEPVVSIMIAKNSEFCIELKRLLLIPRSHEPRPLRHLRQRKDDIQEAHDLAELYGEVV